MGYRMGIIITIIRGAVFETRQRCLHNYCTKISADTPKLVLNTSPRNLTFKIYSWAGLRV